MICNFIYPDIDTIQNNIINDDVKIDLELFEGLGADRDNSIFLNIIEFYTVFVENKTFKFFIKIFQIKL